jgi:hypothetical protein
MKLKMIMATLALLVTSGCSVSNTRLGIISAGGEVRKASYNVLSVNQDQRQRS